MKSKQRTKVTIGPLVDQAGEIITEDGVAANMMNNYFAVFLQKKIQGVYLNLTFFNSTLESEKLLTFEITEEEVGNKLNKLNVGKSSGPDEIHPKLLYELRNELTNPITKLFNL